MDEKDKKIIEFLKEGNTQKEIAARLKITQQAVSKRIGKINKIRPLSTRKQQILDLIRKKYTIEKIAKVMNSDVSTIRKHIKEISKKGYRINIQPKGGHILQDAKNFDKIPTTWRYHALEFEVKPYYKFPRYSTYRNKYGNRSIIMGKWKYDIYAEKVIVWLSAGKSFESEDKEKVVREAMQDFNKILAKIAERVGFQVWKNQKANIRLTNHHLSYKDAPEWDVVTKDRMYVIIKGRDNKIWLAYDVSEGFRERETRHPDRAVDDADMLEEYLNDLRDQRPPKISELTRLQGKNIEQLNILTSTVLSNTQTVKIILNMIKPPTPGENPEQTELPEYIG